MSSSQGSVSAVKVVSLAAALLGIVACAKEDKRPAPAAASAAALPSAATVPAASANAAPPTCTVEAEKVWAANASAASGISQTEIDSGKVLFGVVLGGKPEVVVFDAKGEGEAKHVGVKKALADAIPKGTGRREIHRVTPAVGSGGEILAFVDYEQIGKDHRTVACGPSDSNNELLKFDGKPLVSVAADQLDPKSDAAGTAKPAPGASAKEPPSAPPAPAAKDLAVHDKPAAPAAPVDLSRDHLPPAMRPVELAHLAEIKKQRLEAVRAARTAAAASAPRLPVAPAAKSSKPKGDKVRELRDCRTFVDHNGAHAWSTGSELVGQPQEDGSTEWNMEFFAEQELGRGRVMLTASPLGKTPQSCPSTSRPSRSISETASFRWPLATGAVCSRGFSIRPSTHAARCVSSPA